MAMLDAILQDLWLKPIDLVSGHWSAVQNSSHEWTELSQWLYHDETTITLSK